MNDGVQIDDSEVLIVNPNENERSDQVFGYESVEPAGRRHQGGAIDKTQQDTDGMFPVDSGEDLPDALVAFLEAEEHDRSMEDSLQEETIDGCYSNSSTKDGKHNDRTKKKPFAQSTLEGKVKAEAIAKLLTEDSGHLSVDSKASTVRAGYRYSTDDTRISIKDRLARRMTVAGEEEATKKYNCNLPKTSLRSSSNFSKPLVVDQVGAHAVGGAGSRRRMRHSTKDFSSGSLRDSKNNYRNILLEDDEMKYLISGDLISGPIVPAKLIRCGTENDELFDDTLSAHLQISKEHRNSVTAQLVINKQDFINEEESVEEEEPANDNAQDKSIQRAVRTSMQEGSNEEGKTTTDGEATSKSGSWKCISVLFGWRRRPRGRREIPASPQ
mmetsp:Transcript_2106/g.3335  ORF Transcript_2106/g.3335 Transcript_2106/m.3335 type:complete len:384 (+) Transcript_2106:45-1196(+)